MSKTAQTAVPVHPLLGERWSPRAFDPAFTLPGRALTALLEAARWAPSANNAQPWRLAVGRRSDEMRLPEPFAAREHAPRTRRPLPDLLLTHPADAALPLSA